MTATAKDEVLKRASRESLIQSFEIDGLYGYRSISLNSDYAATVVIAKNGAGKTTVLGALNAVLKLQFGRLRSLEFSEIRLKLRSAKKTIVITKELIDQFLQIAGEDEFQKIASRAGIEHTSLFNYIVEEFQRTDRISDLDHEHPVIGKLLNAYSYNISKVWETCTSLWEYIYSGPHPISKIAGSISNALADVDIVYLPTYRRVELALTEKPTKYGRRQRPRFNLPTAGLFTGDIQFGLADISDRLEALNEKIVLQSNRGYAEISANIINEIISGALDTLDTDNTPVPSKDELNLFFSRLKHRRTPGMYGPPTILDSENIFSSNISRTSQRFLTFFLGKLNSIILATKTAEAPVDAFISVCNRYLKDETLGSDTSVAEQWISTDAKKLVLDRSSFRVRVESVPSGREMSLNALSSGEKQMISLFASLFLYPPKEKILLIDEPELSLSLDWQQYILVDVLRAPLCRQVVAITHSPFVFDNELEPFAKSLQVRIDPSARPAPTDELEGDDE